MLEAVDLGVELQLELEEEGVVIGGEDGKAVLGMALAAASA